MFRIIDGKKNITQNLQTCQLLFMYLVSENFTFIKNGYFTEPKTGGF